MKRKNNTGITSFLKTYAPNFCWCSKHDLLIMMEQVPELENVTEESFKGTLSNLKINGYFITKKTQHREFETGNIGNLYLRVKQ